MPAYPFADPGDVADLWSSFTEAARQRVANLIEKAAAQLVQKSPFDIEARIVAFRADPEDPTGLDPVIVADVVATVVKRFLVNQDGFASSSETAGPFARSGTYVNRYDKTGSDVRGSLEVTEADIERLRVAQPASLPRTIRTKPRLDGVCRPLTEAELIALQGWPL